MTSVTPPVARPRNDVIDGMRGVAALAVMVHHFSVFGSLEIMKSAYVAVDFFFILAGLVIAQSYAKRLPGSITFWQFIRRRVIRLYPLFLLGLVLGLPVLYLVCGMRQGTYAPHEIITSFVCNLFFLPYFNADNLFYHGTEIVPGPVFPANGSLWNIFFQMFASFFCVLLFRASRGDLLKVIKVSFVLIIVQGFFMAYAENRWAIGVGAGWSTFNFLGGFPRIAYGFTFGVFMCLHLDSQKAEWMLAKTKTLRSNPAFIYLAMTILFFFPLSIKGLYGIIMLAVAAPLLVFLGTQSVCENRLTRRVFGFFGSISYAIYCLHYPIGRGLFALYERAEPRQEASGCFICLLCVVTIVISALATKYYEEPVRAFLARRFA